MSHIVRITDCTAQSSTSAAASNPIIIVQLYRDSLFAPFRRESLHFAPPWKCAVLGLPIEITGEDFALLLEPYASEICDVNITAGYASHDRPTLQQSDATCTTTTAMAMTAARSVEASEDHQVKNHHLLCQTKIAIVEFINEASLREFSNLYNNLHFPNFKNVPPCIVIPLKYCDVIRNEKEKNLKNDEIQDDRKDGAIVECNQHGAECDKNKNMNAIESIRDKDKERIEHDSKNLLSYDPENVLSYQVELPVCTVCLRRLQCTTSGVDGGNDIPVSMWFTGNTERCQVCKVYGEISESDGTHTQTRTGTGTRTEGGTGTGTGTDTGVRIGIRTGSGTGTGNESSINSVIGTTENDKLSQLRHCMACGLTGNIWACLVCAHTGCGRYAKRHAEEHFKETKHSFSLELATGRIWDYSKDNFVHVEGEWGRWIGSSSSSSADSAEFWADTDQTDDRSNSNIDISSSSNSSSSSSSSSTSSNRCRDENGREYDTEEKQKDSENYDDKTDKGRGSEEKEKDYEKDITNNTHNNGAASSSSSSSSSGGMQRSNQGMSGKTGGKMASKNKNSVYDEDKRQSSSSSFYDPSDYLSLSQNIRDRGPGFGPNSYPRNSLPGDTLDKMGVLMQGYENLLESQLADQQIYFEKKLARETIKAIEDSMRRGRSESISSLPTSTSSSTSSTSKIRSDVRESGSSSTCTAVSTDSTYPPNSQLEDNDENNNENENQNQSENTISASRKQLDAVDAQLAVIEASKIEISKLEQEYSEILSSLKEVEAQGRAMRKLNETYIREQKELRNRVEEYNRSEGEIKRKCEAEVEELEQQIRDLCFYTKMKNQVALSPMKEELEGGSVVMPLKGPISNTGQGQGPDKDRDRDKDRDKNGQDSKRRNSVNQHKKK